MGRAGSGSYGTTSRKRLPVPPPNSSRIFGSDPAAEMTPTPVTTTRLRSMRSPNRRLMGVEAGSLNVCC
jgi:hypothetical protein